MFLKRKIGDNSLFIHVFLDFPLFQFLAIPLSLSVFLILLSLTIYLSACVCLSSLSFIFIIGEKSLKVFNTLREVCLCLSQNLGSVA